MERFLCAFEMGCMYHNMHVELIRQHVRAGSLLSTTWDPRDQTLIVRLGGKQLLPHLAGPWGEILISSNC